MNYWRRDTLTRAIIAHMCSFFLVATPMLARFAIADEIVQEADKGRNTGANLLLNYQTPTVIDAPPPADPGDYFDAGGNLRNEIWSQELFPGYNPADPSQITDLSGLMADPANLATQGVGTSIALGAGTGETSEAYQALQDGIANPAHATTDMSAEVFLDASREIIAGDSTMLDEILMSCEEEIIDGGDGVDKVTRLEDIYTCSQAPVGVPENCVVRRDVQLAAVETKEILRVEAGGGTCTPSPGGSGQDINDWAPDWYADPSGNAPASACRKNVTGPLSFAGTFLYFWDTNARGGAAYYLAPTFCGDFSAASPSGAECDVESTRLEHACRNSPDGPFDSFDGSQLNPARGPVGSCASYAGYDAQNRYDGTVAVDYTGCDQDRIDYCSAVKTDFNAECTIDPGTTCPSCGTGSGLDINHWGPPNGDWQASTIVNPTGAPECYLNWTLSSPEWYWRINFGASISAKYCGDFAVDSHTPAQCASTANLHEWRCRNATTFTGGELNPARGPIGICPAQYTGFTIGDPVDYAGCTPERQTYCEAVAAEYVDECSGACTGGGTCEAEDNWALYNSGFFNNTDVVNNCSTVQQYFGVGTAPTLATLVGSSERTFSFGNRVIIGPDDYTVFGWSNEACGTTPNPADCSTLGQTFYDSCVFIPGGTWTKLWAGGAPSDIPAYCAAERATYEANCNAANVCLGGGVSGGPMNGTDTITASGLPAGEVRNETHFGTDVEITETPFDPTSHGLAAGQYVIANYDVTGVGVDSFTIADGGAYDTNWDYQLEVTTTDSELFTVEATLYEIVANDFIFEGCSQADVDNVNTGFCSGSITCTDLQVPCRTVDGVEICEQPGISDGITELLLPWNDFAGGTPEMCWEADVQVDECTIAHDCIASGECVADCGDLPPALQAECEAPACWIEASTGTEICLDSTAETWLNNLGEPGYVDDCADLLSDPACVLLPERSCVEGMEDESDPSLCWLTSVYFDCGSDVTVPGVPGADESEVTCAGDFRCFGDECANQARESNPDFVRAATATTTITEMTKDINCDIEGDPTSCTLFTGTDERCRDPRGITLGLIPDCCKESREAGQSAGNFIQYMQLARYTYELAQKPFVAAYLSQSYSGSAVQSAISIGDPVSKAIGGVKQHISNGFSSALKWAGFKPVEAATEAGKIVGDVAASPTAFGPVQQFVATGVRNFLNSIGLSDFATQLFDATTEGIVTGWAEQGLGKMVAGVISIIGTIYLIYSILKILGSIFFKCKDSELEFGIQQVNRMCHYVGDYCSKKVNLLLTKKCIIETKTYCCFSSPLARIMNEQLRVQGVGGDWGTATEPVCDGITIADLETVDWDLVNLSEWEAILFEAGLVPDPRDPPLNFIPTDIHPGDAIGGTGEGVDSVTLNLEAIDTVMPEMEAGRTILEGEDMSQSDPELMPWYE